jgi:hypothetical protein
MHVSSPQGLVEVRPPRHSPDSGYQTGLNPGEYADSELHVAGHHPQIQRRRTQLSKRQGRVVRMSGVTSR